MAGCSDKRFEEMLYAYELGLLEEDEERELEIHLLECGSCFEKVRNMSRASDLLRHSPRIREAMLGDSVGPEMRDADKPAVRRPWPKLLPIGLAAAAVLIFLILQPWDIRISPRQEAMASENRLLIMPFRNLADPADSSRLGEIAANLLITDLSESRFVNVVSSQRIHDLKRLEGFEASSPSEPADISTLADRARARWLLLGDILQAVPTLEVTIQVTDATNGTIIASYRLSGGGDEDIFSLVDRISVAVKEALALPMAALEEPDRPVAEVTTYSTEAYRWYLTGIENLNKLYNTEAISDFEKALEYDSTMAMAHYHLAMLKDRAHVDKAVLYSSGTSRRERSFIVALKAVAEQDYQGAIDELTQLTKEYPEEKEAHFRIGRYYLALGQKDEAVKHFEKAVEIDPLYKIVHNQLAYSYLNIGDYEKSLVAINKYIEIAPDEANPYDSRGDICAAAGRLDDAIASYRKALEVKPDFSHSLMSLGFMYLFDKRYEPADSCLKAYTEMVEGSYLKSAGRLYETYVPIHQGKFEAALRLLDAHLAADNRETDVESTYDYQAEKHCLKALIYREQGKYHQVLSETERSMELFRKTHPNDRWAYQYLYVQFLAEAGQYDRATALTAELEAYLESLGQVEKPEYWYADGCIHLARGDYEKAVTSLSQARRNSSRVYTLYMLGRAYLEAGSLDGAVAQFQRLLDSYNSDRAHWSIWAINAHYFLGRAYEESRWYDRAAEQYRLFVDLRKNADTLIALVDDARQRLAKIESQP